MSADDKTVEAAFDAAEDVLATWCTGSKDGNHSDTPCVCPDDTVTGLIVRAAIEAHEAAKGEGGIPLVDQEAFREAFFETWTSATPVGAVATIEQAWSMVEAVLDNADPTPTPSESEREALADLADDIIDRANIEDVNPGSVAEVIEAVVTEHGFRRHPTPAPALVETVEELEALPEGTVIRDALDFTFERFNGKWRSIPSHTELTLPATVLTPATSATVSAEQAWREGATWAAVECGAIPHERVNWLTDDDNPYRDQS